MSDKRTDSGQFYPGGKIIVHPEEAPPQTTVAWNDVTGKPATFPPSEHNHTKSQITDFPNFKTVNGQQITGSGNIQISGGWKNNGIILFTDDEPFHELRSGVVLRTYKTLEMGLYGGLTLPDGVDEFEFLVEPDLWDDGGYGGAKSYSLEFGYSETVQGRYGNQWSGPVSLSELIGEYSRHGGEFAYFTKVRIIKHADGWYVEVN